jgi:LysM repeat protein
VLPVKKVNKFYELGEDVYDLPQITEVAAVEEQGNKELEKPTISTEVVKQELPIQVKKEVSGKRTIIYVVRKGDAISIIADYYDCYVSDIKRWNGLRSTRINYGQRLKIVIPASKYDYYIRINKMSSAELNRIRNKD